MSLNLKGLDYKQHGSKSDEINICCPFCVQRGHTPDTRYRLGVNIRTGQAHCFNCEWKGSGQKTLDDLKIYINLGYTDPVEPVVVTKTSVKLPSDFILLADEGEELCESAWKYLISRGATQPQIVRHKIGYSTSGLYAYRIIFPVWNRKKKLAGFVGRDWTGTQKLRYKNSEGEIKNTLYNAHRLDVFKKSGDYVVLTEGVMDCLAVERAGYQCCALLGRALTEQQEHELRGIKNICVFLDWDDDGVKTGLETASRLSSSQRQVYVATPKNGKKDAGEMDDLEIKCALGTASRYTPGLRQLIQIRYEKEKRS